MNIAAWMNDTLHNLWENCEVGKIKNIVEDIEGITNEHLEIQSVDGNYDRALELKGWIKFSSGRWLYFKDDFVPTKRQLKVISTWLNERAKDTKVYLGEGFVSYDILESLINSALE